MREGYRHPARISPDIEHLHHHRWDLLEETGEESRRAEREKVREREAEGREVRSKRERGGRGVRGTKCCETKKKEKKQRE